VLTLYGGITGLCWGAASGMMVCGPPSIGAGLRSSWEALHKAHTAFVTFTEAVKQGCKDALQNAQTTELGPGEEPIELNPLRAAVAILAGMISGIVGAAAYLLIGIRVIAPVTLSTWRCIAEMEMPMPIAGPLYIMSPFVVLLVVLIYPFVGFLVCFSAAGSTLYTELDLVQLHQRINPPKPKRQPQHQKKSWFPSFRRQPVQQPEMTEPLLAPTVATSERGCCHRIGHFFGVTGIPFARQSTAQCIRLWWQGNWHVANDGPHVIYQHIVGTCSGITNCFKGIDKCLSCWCCCCYKSARGRELEGCAEQSPAPESDEDCEECGDTLAVPPVQSDINSEHDVRLCAQ